MKLFTQTVTLQTNHTKDEVVARLRAQLSAVRNTSLEYDGSINPDGSFTARPNPPQGMRGRGTMPVFSGRVEEVGQTCRVYITFCLPPIIAVILCMAEVITLTVAALMYAQVIAFGGFPVWVLPIFALLTPVLFYGTYCYEVHNAITCLKGVL